MDLLSMQVYERMEQCDVENDGVLAGLTRYRNEKEWEIEI